jgi:AcrR family transcriptional regulator
VVDPLQSRSARARLNDEAIRDAGLDQLDKKGTDLLSLSDVGHAAGLTHGAMYARYENIQELFVDLWIHRCSQPLLDFVDFVNEMAEHPSLEKLDEWWKLISEPSRELFGGFYLMASSRRIEELDEEIRPLLQDRLPIQSRDTQFPRQAKAHFFVFYSLWMVLSNSIQPEENYWPLVRQWFLRILEDDTPIGEHEIELMTPIPISVDDGDEFRTNLYRGTAAVVGKTGYTSATISRIARRTPCTPSAIYKLFPSKEDLAIAVHLESLRSVAMRVDTTIPVFDLDSVTMWAYETAADENALRRDFEFEFAIASMANERMLRTLEGSIHLAEDWLCDRFDNPQQPEVRAAVRVLVYIGAVLPSMGVYCGSRSYNELRLILQPWMKAVVESIGEVGA